MKEPQDIQNRKNKSYNYILGFLLLGTGFIVAYLFLPPEQKVLEIPVEKVKYVDRVVEKRVEVPVEKIKYVDRVVEKKVEVPVEVVKYVDRKVEKSAKPKNTNWNGLMKGMTESAVTILLGRPISVERRNGLVYWRYQNNGVVVFEKNDNYINNGYYGNNDTINVGLELVSWWYEPY